jgi:hypothetical protein
MNDAVATARPPMNFAALFRKNPYLVAFVLGAVGLTILPLLQRQFLRAPAPIDSLPQWSAVSVDGQHVLSSQLRGRVLIVSEAQSAEHQEPMKSVLRHVSDLSEIAVVSLLPRDRSPALDAFAKASMTDRWFFIEPDSRLSDALEKFQSSKQLVLVDQNGDVRGVWKDDELSRGNIINAARMLARYGPNP